MKVTIGNVVCAATGVNAWAMTTGVHPHTAVFTVHQSQWPDIEDMLGNEQTLTMEGLNGKIEVKRLTPLHEVPSPGQKNRRAFVVADRRWKWPYKLVVRDYNMIRKTGDKRMLLEHRVVPVELAQYRDRYQFLSYSLDSRGNRWVAQRVVEDVLKILEPGNWGIDSWPMREEAGTERGVLSIRNLMLRDNGAMAMARVMQHVPGFDIYIDYDGTVIGFNAADLKIASEVVKEVEPISQYSGFARHINRGAIRPSKVYVHFVREVEIRLDYQESQTGTAPAVDKDDPFIENVLPLPDPITYNVHLRDEERAVYTDDCPQGTWVPVSEALRIWEEERQQDKAGGGIVGLPYSWDIIRYHFPRGTLHEQWAGPDYAMDVSTTSSALARTNAFMRHFRQTFRINPKYMRRIRELRGVRVALLDPITGTRSPAMAWSEYAISPTSKGTRVVLQGNPDTVGQWYNVNGYPGYDSELSNEPASQMTVSIIDAQLGIFRVDFAPNPYGMAGSAIPGRLGDEDTEEPVIGHRALRHQDDYPIAPGMRVEGAPAPILRESFNIAVCMAFIPNTPNDRRQLHIETVLDKQIGEKFKDAYALSAGSGPPLEIFVPPSVCTARFGWFDTSTARKTIKYLIGLEQEPDDPTLGADVEEMPGFVFVNGDDEIPGNAQAAAVESMVNYADTLSGVIEGAVSPVRMRGNVAAIAHAHESGGRLMTGIQFRDRQVSVDRYSVLDDTVRHITLGVIPYGKDDR